MTPDARKERRPDLPKQTRTPSQYADTAKNGYKHIIALHAQKATINPKGALTHHLTAAQVLAERTADTMAAPIIAITATKGGTGKSSTVCALAQAAAFRGMKPLVCDLDAQANATLFLNAQPGGSYAAITGQAPARALLQTVGGVDILAGSADLAALDTRHGSGERLKNALQPIRRYYDLVLLDTGPGMNEALFEALFAATRAIIPLKADAASLQALYNTLDLIRHAQEVNQRLKVTGAIITQFDGRPSITRFFRDAIRDKGQEAGALLIATIRQGTKLQEAQAMQESLFSTAPTSKPAQDYLQLLDTLTGKEGKQ